MRTLLTLAIVLFASSVFAQDIGDRQINSYVTKNFHILSIDDNQGRELYNKVEFLKSWIFKRWGLNDIAFEQRAGIPKGESPRRCIIICVPNDELFKKLIKRDTNLDPGVDENGNPVIWISFDKIHGNWISSVLATKVSAVCLNEWQRQYRIMLPPILEQGMSFLNADPTYIASHISATTIVDANGSYSESAFSVEKLLTMSKDEFKSLSYDKKKIFMIQSGVFLLLLKKEFNNSEKFRKFCEFLTSSNTKNGLEIFNFIGYDDLDKTYRNYMYNLCWDIKNNKTPKSYLTWFSK